MFHLHQWSKWSQPFNTEVKRAMGSFGKWAMCPITAQARICLRCGAIQCRYIGDGHFGEGNKPNFSDVEINAQPG